MKNPLLIVVGTAGVFSAGLGTGIWVERTKPVPAPPIGLMGELSDVPRGNIAHRPSTVSQPERLPQLQAELDGLKTEIETFRKQLDPIKTEFNQGLNAILTAEQRDRLVAMNDRAFGPSASVDGKSGKAMQPLDSMIPFVIVPSTLDRLTEELKLTDAQRSSVRLLLLTRRAQFLKLVDVLPPPSLKLGRLAPLIPTIAQPDVK
jgi:hypothetical protein